MHALCVQTRCGLLTLHCSQGMYNRAAEFWAELRVELLSANALLTVKKPKNDPLWRLYWANHQVCSMC